MKTGKDRCEDRQPAFILRFLPEMIVPTGPAALVPGPKVEELRYHVRAARQIVREGGNGLDVARILELSKHLGWIGMIVEDEIDVKGECNGLGTCTSPDHE